VHISPYRRPLPKHTYDHCLSARAVHVIAHNACYYGDSGSHVQGCAPPVIGWLHAPRRDLVMRSQIGVTFGIFIGGDKTRGGSDAPTPAMLQSWTAPV
jgi:hypothetical protein